jgi:radical SAM superfamily enzyme YgiQ (UPF0313 family)
MKAAVIDAFSTGKGIGINFHIGVAGRLITTILRKAGVDASLYTYKTVFENPDVLCNCDAVLVTAMTLDREVALKLSVLSAKKNPYAIRILGGPIAFDPNDFFAKSPYELAVVGEGESTLQELVKVEFELSAAEEIIGVAYKDNGRVAFSPRSSFEPYEVLSVIPEPRLIHSYPKFKFSRVAVECIRGCSNFFRPRIHLPDGRKCVECGNCTSTSLAKRLECPSGIQPGCGYCPVPSVFGPPRSREMKVIVEEIRGLAREGASRISLTAPDILDYQREKLTAPEPLTDPFSPPANLEKLEKLLNSLSRIKGIAYSLEEVKSSLLTQEVLEMIAEYLPGSDISIVCESGSMEQLREIGRPFDPDKNIELTRKASELGLRPMAFFINHLPNSTMERGFETTALMSKLEKAGCRRILCYKLAALPATSFYGMNVPSKDRVSEIIMKKAEEINTRRIREYLHRPVKVQVAKSRHIFKSARGKNGKDRNEFKCAIGFVHPDVGIYTPIAFIDDPYWDLKEGVDIEVIPYEQISSRAVRARVIS